MQESFRNSNKVLLSCFNMEVWFCIYDGNMFKKIYVQTVPFPPKFLQFEQSASY